MGMYLAHTEFENTEGDEAHADLSPSSQNDPEVYILPLTEVSLPVAKQPGKSSETILALSAGEWTLCLGWYSGTRRCCSADKSHNVRVKGSARGWNEKILEHCRGVQLMKSTDLGRHSLLYIKELGRGWFGKVLLGEVHVGLGSTQVVVKELKASASVQEQKQFLDEVQPYRVLQHPALLQCLSQCAEITPYLLVMEHCPLGDVKGYLRSCRAMDSVTPDPLILQRMACEIASGLTYLHKHSYIHRILVSPGNNILVLPEFISQTPASVILDLALRNCLLTSELAVKIGDYGLSQSKYKDDYYVTADQIWVPLRWIAPELIDEVHGNLLVVDQTKASNVWSLGVTIWELFELGNQPYRHYSDRHVLTYAIKEQQLKLPKPPLKVPLCDRWYEVMQFCWLQPEQRPVVEEVHLLLSYLCTKGGKEAEEEFEKRWNSLKPNLGSTSCQRTPTPEVIPSSFPLLEHFDMADSFQSENGDELLTVTETSQGLNFEYKWEHARTEHPYCSSSASGPLGKNNPHYQDVYYPNSDSTDSCKGVSASFYESDHPGVVPVLSAHSPSVSSEYYIRIEEPAECNISLEDTNLDYSPAIDAGNSRLSSAGSRSLHESEPNSYWSASKELNNSDYDSDSSLSMEALHRVSHSEETDQPETYFSSENQQVSHREQSPQAGTRLLLTRSRVSDSSHEIIGLESLCNPLEVMNESPLGVSVSLSSPSLARCDPYLESHQRTAETSISNEAYYHMLSPLQKTKLRPHFMSVDVETGDSLLLGRRSPEDDDDLFSQNILTNWNSNHSANNNSLSDYKHAVGFQDAYLDLRHPTPSSRMRNVKLRMLETSKMCMYNSNNSVKVHSYMEANSFTLTSSDIHRESVAREYLQLSPEGTRDVDSSSKCHSATEIQPIQTRQENKDQKNINNLQFESCEVVNSPTLASQSLVSKEMVVETRILNSQKRAPGTVGLDGMVSYPKNHSKRVIEHNLTDILVVPDSSSTNLVEFKACNAECSDIPSSVFVDYPMDYSEVGDIDLNSRLLQRPNGLRLCENSISLVSSSPCEAFSPDTYHTVIQPKSLDSGYDTENNESPEFILKDLEGTPALSTSVESDDCDMVLQMDLEEDVIPASIRLPIISCKERNQYRDSAYFSDYDLENEKSPCEGNRNKDVPKRAHFPDKKERNIPVPKDMTVGPLEKTNQNLCSSPSTIPLISMFSPLPSEMGGCLTKESTPDEGIGLESDHSGEEPISDYSSSTQEASGLGEQTNGGSRDNSSAESFGSDSTIVDFSVEMDHPELTMEEHNEEEEEVNVDVDSAQNSGHEQALSKPKHDDYLENILPALPADLDFPAPLGNVDEADEEDSDDSDESDELCSYNIQEQSDESDNEFPVVPVIVSDRSSARHLRSLLKTPSIHTQSIGDELQTKKKAVSFFDDVTVFLFDQESPTGDLGDFNFPMVEPNGQATAVELPQNLNKFTAYEDASGKNASDEYGFPLMPNPSSTEPGSEEITTPPNSPTQSPEEKPTPVFSRFSVSRFSITQVSDSEVDSMGGSSGNGDDE
ncbi:hypothetical protein DNTS_032923 [Danionella cerebrum]|uniref:non-specific serine/threonine protein kinase n=1 Tax=Danionella cerebrum TaxID=2873325 RepID=A0A553QJ33_9TELE|nr:hypothetical protein DNTS_032923 [Danionella translucida]